MKNHQGEYTVVEMAKVLQASRSGYYKWLRQPQSHHQVYDEQLWLVIQQIYKQHKGRYGSPRITDDLHDQGYRCSKHRVARIMREHKLQAKAARRYKVTTDSEHPDPIAPNLVQQKFHADQANALWLSDITYIWTNERWLYLAVVLDVYNRKVVGWSLGDRLTKELVVTAIRQALDRERPGAGLIFHSDRGCQYASQVVRDLLAGENIRQSMSGKGNCYDNAMMESFYHTFKVELVYQEHFTTRFQARQSIFEYIEVYYNRQRKHSALGYVAPVQFSEMKNVA
jgi:transposase InsO family protein